jgi:hypothetical protein
MGFPFQWIMDHGTLAFPSIPLNCEADENRNPREPLVYLKSLFSPSVGLNLVTMWSLCSNSDRQHDNPHNLDAFIDHMSETCLALVGIPFSILDKKIEKRMLASRRQCISDLLQYTSEKEQVLLSSTVFLFQLSKNASIVGRGTIHLVLNSVLGRDKKIPQSVTNTLFKLNSEGDAEGLIATVKKFATAKNIKALTTVVANE